MGSLRMLRKGEKQACAVPGSIVHTNTPAEMAGINVEIVGRELAFR